MAAGPQDDSDRKPRPNHAIYSRETAGLLLLAFFLLIFTMIRYRHAIHWSWR